MEVFKSISIGVIATLGMSVSMWLITKLKIANADMIRAVGSLMTRDKKLSFRVGIVIHLISGTIFSLPYTLVISLLTSSLGLSSAFSSSVFGGVMGFVHGFVVSFLLVVFVAQNHPLEQYREPGLSVAGSHIVGHIVYGILVGCFSYIMGVNYTFLLPIESTTPVQ